MPALKKILKCIKEIDTKGNVDPNGKEQHSFKKKMSTDTVGLVLQSIITNDLDMDDNVLMASLDNSAAFDIVNIDLLMKRLTILGLSDDVLCNKKMVEKSKMVRNVQQTPGHRNSIKKQ